MSKYKSIVDELEKKINILKKDGVNITRLDDLIDTLKGHVNDISDVEEHIDAVKSEIISPIAKDLKDNKIAGKFSIMGFYVGTFGLLASVVSLLYTTFYVNIDNNKTVLWPNVGNNKAISYSNAGNNKTVLCSNSASLKKIDKMARKIDEIQRELLFKNGKLVLADGEVKIPWKGNCIIAEGKGTKISIWFWGRREEFCKKENKMVNVAVLKIFHNESLITHTGVPEIISIKTNHEYSPILNSGVYFSVASNDKITFFGKDEIEVARVLYTESSSSSLSDKEDALIIRRVKHPDGQKEPKTKPKVESRIVAKVATKNKHASQATGASRGKNR